VGAGRWLLTPLVVVAAVNRSRRGGGGAAAEPYPQSSAASRMPQPQGAARGGGQERSSAAPGPGKGVPGGEAEKPSQIPAKGWKEVLLRTKQQIKEDNVTLLAAGVAFYLFLALFPALIAAVTIYGLVADPQQVEEQIGSVADTLPQEAAALLETQLKDIATASSAALGWGLVASLGGALFAASGGVQNLINAVNVAYDEEETRGFLKLRGLALLMTLGAVLFLAVAVGLIAVLPVVLNALNLGAVALVAVQIARFAGLIVAVAVALAIIYRYAPDRDNPKLRWVGLGSLVATVLWVLGSLAFSLYVSNFGSYGKTYGALAGVVVLLLWLWLTSLIVLIGAEINSETEMQTAEDTTEGPEKPMGERDAVKADSVVHS
jgi:membrane protein